jgi:hypothetical protein
MCSVCEAGSGGTAFVWVCLGGLTWAVVRNLVSLGTKGGLYRGGEGRLRGGDISRCLSLPHSTRLDEILNGCWPSTSTLNYNTHTHTLLHHLPNTPTNQTVTMIVTRLVSLILRAAQFVFAAVVLGLTAYFLHQRLSHGVGPLGRVIYTVIWSSLSILFSVIWMIPTKSTIASYGSDLRTFLTFPPASLTTLTPPTSLHSRLGRRLRRAGALLQHAELRQRVGVDGLQSAPQQRVRAVEGCAGLLVPVAGRVVCDFCAGCHYVPPSQPPARRQRGPW